MEVQGFKGEDVGDCYGLNVSSKNSCVGKLICNSVEGGAFKKRLGHEGLPFVNGLIHSWINGLTSYCRSGFVIHRVGCYKNSLLRWAWWHLTIISATQEAKTGFPA